MIEKNNGNEDKGDVTIYYTKRKKFKEGIKKWTEETAHKVGTKEIERNKIDRMWNRRNYK